MAYLPTQSVCSVIAPVQTTASMIAPSQTVSSVNASPLTITGATMPVQTTTTSSGANAPTPLTVLSGDMTTSVKSLVQTTGSDLLIASMTAKGSV